MENRPRSITEGLNGEKDSLWPGCAAPERSLDGSADCATFRYSNEFGYGLHSHLLHHVGTMDFDCLLDGAQLAGDLFVQFSSNDVFEHFSLARRERRQTRADFGKFGLISTKGAVFLNRYANGCKQVLIVHRFGKEITRAAFHRLHAL